MAQTDYRTALIVGAGSGLSASLARAVRQGRHEGRARRAQRRRSRGADGRRSAAKRSPAMPPSAATWRKLFADVEAAFGAPDVVVYNASYRTRGPFVELDPAEVEKTLAVSAFGGFLVAQEAAQAHAAARPRRDPVHRRLGEREGLCAVGAVRHGQVRAARARAKHGARACARRASTSPMSSSTAASAARGVPIRPTSPTACSIPTPSRRAICTSCSSRAAPGPGRSSCGPGWRGSKASKSSLGRRPGSL